MEHMQVVTQALSLLMLHLPPTALCSGQDQEPNVFPPAQAELYLWKEEA